MLRYEGNMQTRKLGNSDLHITPTGFGAWAAGGPGWEFSWGPQEDSDSIAAIHRALELGVNWIDTAAVYGLGHSEEVVARALKEWRGARPYIFTKCVLTLGSRSQNHSQFLRQVPSARSAKAAFAVCKSDTIDFVSDALAAG